MMCRFVILGALLFALKEVQGETTEVSQCVRNNGTLPINVYVEGCLKPPCILHQLEDVVVNVVFKAPYLLHELTTKALAILKIVFPIEVDYDLKQTSVTCNFLTNTYCPIIKDEVVQYTLRMYIESFFPAGTSATIEFRVENKNKLPVWCIRLPIKVVGPRKGTEIYQNDHI